MTDQDDPFRNIHPESVRLHWIRWFERHENEKQLRAAAAIAAAQERQHQLDLLYRFGGI